MKKDIEWLKERVLSKKKSAELNVMAHEEGLSEDFESRAIAYEKVLKDINQLDKPETLSQEWIDKYAQGDYGAWVYTKDLQDLLVPKRELPVMPKLDGFTVGEEQLFYVVGKDNTAILSKGIDGNPYPREGVFSDYFVGHEDYMFTEQEIKDYDPRYWVFKKPVEELEE